MSRVSRNKVSSKSSAIRNVADLPPLRQHALPRQHLRRRLHRRGPARPLRRDQPLAVGHRGARRARAADPVQPRATRRRQRDRLPLLPHVGRGFGLRRDPTDQNLHELPLTDLFHQPVSRAGAPELSIGSVDPVDARARPARFRVLRPQHPSAQGHRLHDLPRTGRSHAAHVAGEVAADGMVHRLPSQPRALRAPARRRVHRRLHAAAGSTGAGTPARRRVSDSKAHELLDVSSMSRDTPRDSGFGIRDSGPQASRESQTSPKSQMSPKSRIPNPESREFWRTLDELAGDPAFQEWLYNEFPSQIEAVADPVARRTFLKLMGASLALGGFTACTRQPAEKILPYVRQPEGLVPGKPLFYATAMALGGVATGLLVESHEGRPTKIEGNPEHPGSLGATDVFAQAAVLGLYDPDRSQTLLTLGEIRPWPRFLGAIRSVLGAQQPLQGRGLRLLTESISSPTLAAQIHEWLSRYPAAKWHQWDTASHDNARAGAKLAFGEL